MALLKKTNEAPTNSRSRSFAKGDKNKKLVSSQNKEQESEVKKKASFPKQDNQKGKIDQRLKKNKKVKAEEKNFGKRLKTRAIIILGINFVGIIILVILLRKLPTKALELKGLKNSIITAEQSAEVNFADLELKSNKELAEKLLVMYPDEVGLVNFIQEIEKLKKRGIVTNFSFANQTPVRDKTRYLGIPIAIEIKGNWKEISGALVDLQKLPYLFRPVSMSTQPDSEEGLINVRYGGFLYVDESLEEK